MGGQTKEERTKVLCPFASWSIPQNTYQAVGIRETVTSLESGAVVGGQATFYIGSDTH